MLAAQATPYQDYVQACVGMHLYNLQQWRTICENARQTQKTAFTAPAETHSARQAKQAPTQNFYAQLHKRFVESQIGVCRFFEKRWSAYAELPEMAAGARSPADILRLQAGFMTTLAEDYTNQAVKMVQAVLSPTGMPARLR